MVNKKYLLKQLKKRDFEKILVEFDKINFEYSFENLDKIFPKVDSALLYTFLMYSISKKETINKYIALCECLIYGTPYIYEANHMIYWLVNKAQLLNEDATNLLEWIIDVFACDPSSPFSEEEICVFAKKILKTNPLHENANKIYITYSKPNY